MCDEGPRRRLRQSARFPCLFVVYQMIQAELCRQRAIQCEEEAKWIPSSLEAEPWLKLAKKWRELTDRVEHTRDARLRPP
jgi:hypothetical protein